MTDIANVTVQTTLPALSFDYEGLKAWAESITEQYTGLVVQEDDIAAIKSEMAGLNKLKAKLETARKETVRQVSAPIKDFEARIKEVVGIFESTYGFLGSQVQAFEDAAREDKRREVLVVIASVLDENKLTGLNIPVQDSWLNKSKPLKTVKAEVEGIVLAHLKELREKAELEQARQDRAVAIESTCKALAAEHGFDIPASQFFRFNDLQVPLGEVQAQIAATYMTKAQAMQRAAQQQPTAQVSPVQAQQQPTMHRPPQPPTFNGGQPRATTKTLTLDIEYSAANEPQVQQIIRHLESQCINLTRIPGRVAA